MLLAVESVLISLYGSYSVGNDNHVTEERTEEQSSSVVEIRKELNKAAEKAAPQPSADFPVLEKATTKTKEKDSDTSLPGTANTSSSSSSEDWIINTSLSDSSFAESVVLNSTVNSDDKPEQTLIQVDKEISAENWAMGRAFTDPITGECIEPVKLLQPEAQKDGELAQDTETKSSSPCRRPTNVIVEKMAKLTAYDLISSRSVRQPLSAFALFEQDNRSSILLEKPQASLQDVTTAVKERWESLGEEERKK